MEEILELFSNKVFLEGYPTAQKALISVKNGIISNIELLENPPKGCNVLDFSGFCIMPGLIDLNVRSNSEGISQTSSLALKGGVTTICLEPSHTPVEEEIASPLYCDIVSAQLVDSPEVEIESTASVLKTYLCPSSVSVQSCNDLESLIDLANATERPLIIDPSMINPRMLYIASPCRMLDLSARLNQENKIEKVGDFSMAVEASFKDSDEDSLSPEVKPIKRNFTKEVSSLEIADSIDKDSLFMKELVNAEIDSYKYVDSYRNRSKSNVLERSPIHKGEVQGRSIARKRPPAISILKPVIDENSYISYLMNIPSSWECHGIEYALEILKDKAHCRIHFANVASVEALAILVKSEIENVTWESCPHYLYFSSNDIRPNETNFKTFPPIRTLNNKETAVKFFTAGGVPILSSHHNPTSLMYKVPQFRYALSGISTLGSSLNVVWSTIMANTHPNSAFSLLLQSMCYAPAQFLGINSFKGGIAVGKHADLIVWDPYAQSIEGLDNIYQNKLLYGKIVNVFLRGKLVYGEEECAPCGRFVSNL